MDNLWTRRSNTSKLSLSTGAPSTNGAGSTNESSARSFTGRRNGDNSSHSNRNPFNAMSPSVNSISSPTTGASSAFGLGTGAFASFGSSKTPKTPSGALDFGSLVAKTPTSEKQSKDLSTKQSKTSLIGPKSITPPPAHFLKDGWVIWVRPPIQKSNGFVEYAKTIHQVAEVSSLEGLLSAFRHLKKPSTLPVVSEYHIFKKGIRPIWEDADNKPGGKWIVRLKKGIADRYWEELVFAIAGNQFGEASDEVCGAVLSVRHGEDTLSIWTRKDGGRVLKIRETMKRILAFPADTKLEWKSHISSMDQRAAIDEQRKEKANQHHHSARNNSKEQNDQTFSAEKKQSS